MIGMFAPRRALPELAACTPACIPAFVANLAAGQTLLGRGHARRLDLARASGPAAGICRLVSSRLWIAICGCIPSVENEGNLFWGAERAAS